MLTPFPQTWGRPALADLPTRLAALAAGRGPTPNPHPDPSPARSASDGVVGRWLIDPAGTERRLLAELRAAVTGSWATWHVLLLAVAVGLAVARVGLAWWRARSWRRARDGGRWLQIVPPPQTTTGQGQLVWAGLAGLIRPGRLGRHLRLTCWEVHADDHRLVAGLWLPATVDAGQASRVVTGSYPGARVTAGSERGRHAAPAELAAPRPASAPVWSRPWRPCVRRVASAGYLVVPASTWAPLIADPPPGGGKAGEVTADRLRMSFTGLASTPPGYRAVLQFLARPLPAATARAARRVRLAGGGPPGPGLPARGLLAVVDLALAAVRAGLDLTVPGPATPARSTTTRQTAASRAGDGVVDVVTAQRRREALVKANADLVEVCVRVVVSGPDRTVCRAKAFEIANGLQVATTPKLHAVPLRWHALATVSGRDLSNRRAVGPLAGAGHRRGWLVVTNPELGTLARLPHQPAVYRFETATAPHLPAPLGIPLLPYPDHDGHDADDDFGLTGEAA